MGWPDATEFTEYLQASGLYGLTPSTREALLDLNGALNAGIERWNEMTHYWPFMSNGDVDERRFFDPPTGYILDINGGLVTFTSLASDVAYDENSSSGFNDSLSAGTARTNLLDFRLLPTDAAPRNKPWTHIRLGWTCTGGPGSVVVTGEWGYCRAANLPASVRIAVMALAGNSLLPQITRLMLSNGLKELTRGDETKKWLTPKEMKEGWDSDVAAAFAMGDYVRVRIA